MYLSIYCQSKTLEAFEEEIIVITFPNWITICYATQEQFLIYII